MITNGTIHRSYDPDLDGYIDSDPQGEGSSSEFLQPCPWISQLDAFWNPVEKVDNQQKTSWMQEVLNTPLSSSIHLLSVIDELSCEGAATAYEVSYIGEPVAYLLRGLGFATMGVIALAAIIVHIGLTTIFGTCLVIAESYCYSKEPTTLEVGALIAQRKWDEAEEKIRLLPNEVDRESMTQAMRACMRLHHRR